jgi:hypothetical protein
MSMVDLLSLLMLSVKPSDGLRAGFVDVSTFMPDLLICRPFQLFFTTYIFILSLMQFLLFFCSINRGCVEPCWRVDDIARRAIPT